jgi:hypothetical protein
LDGRRLPRIGRLNAHEAAALRSQLTDRGDEAWKRVQSDARRVGAENDEVHLNVRGRNERTRTKEPAGVSGPDGESSLSEQDVAQSGPGSTPPTVDHIVHRDRLRAAILHANLKMVLQLGSYPWHVGDDIYAKRLQQCRRAEAGKLQELRRVERAAGNDDLCVCMSNACYFALPVFDADGTASRKENPARQGVRDDGEISRRQAWRR